MSDHGLIFRLPERYRQIARMNLRRKGWRAYANWARSYYEYLTGASRIKSRPLKLIFDPTNICQLACPLCPTGIGLLDRGRGHAELSLFRRLMDQVGDYVFMIDFYNWGEPLLHPRLEEFIRIAKSHNIASNLSTNLSMRLSDERIERLLTSGLSEIGIALDGTTEETNGLYRRKAKFDLIVDNMRRIVQARDRLGQTSPLISWLFVVFSFNEHEVARAREMAAEIGVDRLVLRPPFLDVNRYQPSAKDREAIVHWAPRDPKFRTHVAKAPERKRCGWHYTAAAINWDGSVTPCSTSFRMADDFGTFGKAGENPFFDVMNNASFRGARDVMAGRSSQCGDVVCSHCPTPTIQDYHRIVYRQVALFSLVEMVEAARGLFSPGRPRADVADARQAGR